MDEVFDRFPNREAFDVYWKENYVPLTYADVKAGYENFLQEVNNEIFLQDYAQQNLISREDFMENLNQTAEFMFEDLLTEAFYEKNPQVYEMAFTLYEAAELSDGGIGRDVAWAFHEEYHRLYREFLLELFDAHFA